MDYSSSGSGTKRSAIDDYTAVPTKRSTDDYSKRATDYMTSSTTKRGGLDDYATGSKSSRTDYKREVEIRHLPSSSSAVGGSSSYHSSSSLHKSSGSGGGGSGRYDERTSSHSYRRMDDLR